MNAATTGKAAFETLANKDTTQLNLNYRDSSLSIKTKPTQSGLQAGDRAPDVRLANGTWLSEQLRGTEWKLLVFGNAEVQYTKYLRMIKANDKEVIGVYGLSDGLVLIRPDGYIALIAAEPDAVHRYFDRFR